MTSEQDINNALQGKNDAQQGKNNAEQEGQAKAQRITNSDQRDTNAAQNSTNSDVREQLFNLQEKSNSVHEVIIALTDSVRRNTESMTMVSQDLKDNLAVYRKIDNRIDEVEKHAVYIEEMNDMRAKAMKSMWRSTIIGAIVISVVMYTAFYVMNVSELQRLCIARNEASVLQNRTTAITVDCGSILPWK